jgi:hypothetical protein
MPNGDDHHEPVQSLTGTVLPTLSCRIPHTVIAIVIVTATPVNAVSPRVAISGTDNALTNPPPIMGRARSDHHRHDDAPDNGGRRQDYQGSQVCA